MKYNKLVRDKIPEIIISNWDIPITHIAWDKEYIKELKKKLKEEIKEFLKSNDPEELADILEVIYTIWNIQKISPEKLEEIRKNKANQRWWFRKKIILNETINKK